MSFAGSTAIVTGGYAGELSGGPLTGRMAWTGFTEQEMLGRSIRRKVGRVQIPFVETNDLLVLKILAARDKDLEDVRALLRSASKEIDESVVRARLHELGLLVDDSTLVALFDRQVAAVTPTKPSRARRRRS